MDAEFWHERWRGNRIAFHQAGVNPMLARHHGRLAGGRPRGTLFVPLCGKAYDLWWLRGRGWPVLGVELSEIAVRDFFAERGLVPEPEADEAFTRYAADGITLLVGDVFDLTAERLAGVRAVYDRAALIALPPGLRRRYVAHLEAVLPPAAPTLLVTIEYPAGDFAGPPFPLGVGEVEELYVTRREVTHLEARDAMEGEDGLRARGATALTEHAFLVT